MPIMMTRGEKLTFSNHLDQSYGEIQGFCIYPEEETRSIFDVSLLQVSAALVRVLYTEYVVVCTPEYLYMGHAAAVETIMHQVWSTSVHRQSSAHRTSCHCKNSVE